MVDGVPVIDKSKLEKLLTKIAKEFTRKGVPVKPDDIYTPWDDATDKSKGSVVYSALRRTFSLTMPQVHLYRIPVC